MAFVTVSREFGSSGTTISRHAARSLDYAYVDKKTVEKVLAQYGLVTFQEFYDSTHSFWDLLQEGNRDFITVLNHTVQEVSKHNAVFVGRAGFALLQGYENVFHVLIKAPFAFRVDTVMQKMEISDRGMAEALVRQHDRARESFLKTFYKANPNDASPFSLVIDTSCVPVPTAEKWIAEAVRLLEKKDINPLKSTMSIPSDPVLKESINAVFSPL